ncbi:MAG: sensor histidine kinase [Thermoleophilia bacterium]
MSSFHTFIESNMVPIIFAYGLTFFAAGLAIALQPRQLSNFRLARHLWMLAAFGMIHGIAEWGDIFIPIQSPYLSEFWIARLWDLQQTVWAVSFIFLLQFGATMTANHLPWKSGIKSIMLKLLPLWGLAVTIIAVFIVPQAYGQSCIRYLLGFPSAVMTTVAFVLERRIFISYRATSRTYMTLIAVAFGVYAILGGLTVQEHALPGLGWLDYENVFVYTAMPIYFWRMIIGLCLTILIIRAFHMFDLEYRERLEIAEGERALAVERQRIARDLHDGVVQSIYASGLQLEAAARSAATEPEATALSIRHIVGQLNEVITDVRRYIYNLAVAGEDEAGFEMYIRKIADEFSAAGLIPINISIEGKRIELTPRQKQNIAFITQECLSNVVRHAGASSAEIKFNFRPDMLVFTVLDDGSGFTEVSEKIAGKTGGRGLRGMKERAESVGAELMINSNSIEGGTLITLKIPYRRVKGFS